MNWHKLKERFPNSHDEIREFFYTTVNPTMEKFLESKGYNAYPTWIKCLKDYENKLSNQS